jgi:Tfp pilus assembly protein PilN
VNSVNLLPDRQARRSGPRGGRRPLVALGAAVLVGGIGYWGYGVRSDAESLAQQVAAAEADKAQLDGRLQAMLAVDQRASAQLARRGVVVQLSAGRINWERLVRNTVMVIPPRVWLTEITGTQPAATTPGVAPTAVAPAAATAAPQGLHVEGLAFAQPGVAQLMARLDAIPGLGEPRLASSERVVRGGRSLVQFIIDVPVDRRAQDRPTFDVAAVPGAGTPAPAGGGGFVP